MLAHHVFGYTEDVLLPTLVRLPGYPAFLALCFTLFGSANYVAVICIQAAVDLLSCLLLGKLAGRLMGSRAEMATLWLAALCPFTANYAAVALTESLSLFCVVLGPLRTGTLDFDQPRNLGMAPWTRAPPSLFSCARMGACSPRQ